MKNKILFLCGLKSCGKTYYAQKLYEELKPNIIWYDSDSQLLKQNPTFSSCRELYKAVGAAAFRLKEQQAIESIIAELESSSSELKVPVVVSLGGGVCESNNSLKLIDKHGISVYLKESEPVLYERMTLGGLPPYLEENPRQKFHELYEKRNKSYFCFAKYMINLSEWPEKWVLEELKRLIL